jgi:hypothetical protein
VAKLSLLLVEDDPAIAALIGWTFERHDFQVRCTGSGEEALAVRKAELKFEARNLLGTDYRGRGRPQPIPARPPQTMKSGTGPSGGAVPASSMTKSSPAW